MTDEWRQGGTGRDPRRRQDDQVPGRQRQNRRTRRRQQQPVVPDLPRVAVEVPAGEDRHHQHQAQGEQLGGGENGWQATRECGGDREGKRAGGRRDRHAPAERWPAAQGCEEQQDGRKETHT